MRFRAVVKARCARSDAADCAAAALGNYVPWAPLQSLADAGLTAACAFLLGTQDFRLAACGLIRDIVSRKQLHVRSCPQL